MGYWLKSKIGAAAAAIVLAACAAPGEPEPIPAGPVASAPAPAMGPAMEPAPAPAAAEAGAPAGGGGGDIVIVPDGREIPVPSPADPRSMSERREDIRAWDQCIMSSQGAFDSDPMRPQLQSPEEQCSRALGMADRTAVPVSRRDRRR